MLQRDFPFKNFEKFDYRLFLGVLITGLGFILRYYQYDSLPPYNWTQDEFAFAWSGMSLIQDGEFLPVGLSSVPRMIFW